MGGVRVTSQIPALIPTSLWWGEVGHNIDGCIIAQMLIKGNKFARGFILNGSSRMATSPLAIWAAAIGLFLVFQTCWAQQGYVFYDRLIIFSEMC